MYYPCSTDTSVSLNHRDDVLQSVVLLVKQLISLKLKIRNIIEANLRCFSQILNIFNAFAGEY